MSVTIGNLMENGPNIKISQKMHFLMDFLVIRDHFTIVIWQKYLLYSGLRFEFLWTDIPFLAPPQILKLH